MIAKKCFPNSVIKAVCALVGNITFSKNNTIIVLGLSNNNQKIVFGFGYDANVSKVCLGAYKGLVLSYFT